MIGQCYDENRGQNQFKVSGLSIVEFTGHYLHDKSKINGLIFDLSKDSFDLMSYVVQWGKIWEIENESFGLIKDHSLYIRFLDCSIIIEAGEHWYPTDAWDLCIHELGNCPERLYVPNISSGWFQCYSGPYWLDVYDRWGRKLISTESNGDYLELNNGVYIVHVKYGSFEYWGDLNIVK